MDKSKLLALKELEILLLNSNIYVHKYHQKLLNAAFGETHWHSAMQAWATEDLTAMRSLHQAIISGWAWSIDGVNGACLWYPWVEGDAPHIYGEIKDKSKIAGSWLYALVQAKIMQLEGKLAE